ncbi:MAG: NrfD/PsrC family molybdoenzyme membrane anchor subunit [Symbiopectobacterium sp.]|uniref:NrfD/PsrC family molybdoenzyme membrane anchor subunit n=1 Tax=Symbiopectobacterium sp. TaxID=2952789 RepID=UPI0039E93CE4
MPLFTLFLGLWFMAVQYKTHTGKSFAATRWLALFSALAAVGLLIYTGREASILRVWPIWFNYAFPITMFLSALQTLLALLIFSMRRDDAWRRRLARAQLLSLLALAGTVILWVTGDTVSGNAIRLWLINSDSARLYASAWEALWFCTTLLAIAISLRVQVTITLLRHGPDLADSLDTADSGPNRS